MRTPGPIRATSLSSMLALALLAAGSTGCYETVRTVYVQEPRPVAVAPAPVAPPPEAVSDGDDDEEESEPASVDVFYERLSPYGEWVEVAPYGRVWRPSVEVVGEDFVPYGSRGHWVSTDAGWVFESKYDFGWATYHYGRWYFDDVRGWVWIPDTVWGPSWVDWRYGDDYIGWVPLGPPGVVIVERRWTFVESRHFCDRGVLRHAVPAERVHVAYAASVHVSDESPHGGGKWRSGPPVEQVSHAIGSPVRTAHFEAPSEGTIRVRTPPHRPTAGSAGGAARPSISPSAAGGGAISPSAGARPSVSPSAAGSGGISPAPRPSVSPSAAGGRSISPSSPAKPSVSPSRGLSPAHKR